MKKAGVCFDYVDFPLVNFSDIIFHCYWVNLCSLAVIEGSVNDGTRFSTIC